MRPPRTRTRTACRTRRRAERVIVWLGTATHGCGGRLPQTPGLTNPPCGSLSRSMDIALTPVTPPPPPYPPFASACVPLLSLGLLSSGLVFTTPRPPPPCLTRLQPRRRHHLPERPRQQPLRRLQTRRVPARSRRRRRRRRGRRRNRRRHCTRRSVGLPGRRRRRRPATGPCCCVGQWRRRRQWRRWRRHGPQCVEAHGCGEGVGGQLLCPHPHPVRHHQRLWGRPRGAGGGGG